MVHSVSGLENDWSNRPQVDDSASLASNQLPRQKCNHYATNRKASQEKAHTG